MAKLKISKSGLTAQLFRSGPGVCIPGLIGAAVVLLLAFLVLLVPFNLHDEGLWWTVLAALLIYNLIKCFCESFGKNAKTGKGYSLGFTAAAAGILLVVFLVICLSGAKLFHASEYASILQIEDGDFTEELPEAEGTDSIALMDTDSARMLGDRKIGSLSSLVSQFDVSDSYTQIDYNGSPEKVAALDYAGFFKWINNRAQGVPGYVTVDPVSMSASYQQLENGMVYVPSAYFLQDAGRHIYFAYPTTMWGNLHFEIDEEGNPCYIASVYKKTVSLFGGQTVSGCIILDPVTGEMQKYELADIPAWVDDVYDGDTICEQYNWHGTLQNGFWNSLFGKKGCNRVTTYYSDEENDDVPVSDYGYVAKDGDIWIYTGVTSVNSDSSNIGFLLANERTGESHYFSISGADERSAMSAAEGEVQEKGYQASFPSLINVDGTPTYIMVLKDNSGLVKLYAAVNVEQYNLVTTAATQEECLNKYRALLGIEGNGTDAGSTGTAEIPDADTGSNTADNAENYTWNYTGSSEAALEYESTLTADGEAVVTIREMRFIEIDGNTWVYLIGMDDSISKALVSTHEDLLLLQPGDMVKLTLSGTRVLAAEQLAEAPAEESKQ